MLNNDERLYYANAGHALETLLIQIYHEESAKLQPKYSSPETAFAERAVKAAEGVRAAYMVLLDVPLPKGYGAYDREISRKIARNLREFLADDLNGKDQAG